MLARSIHPLFDLIYKNLGGRVLKFISARMIFTVAYGTVH